MEFKIFLKILVAFILGVVNLGAAAHMGAVGFDLISGSADASAGIFVLTLFTLFGWMGAEAIG